MMTVAIRDLPGRSVLDASGRVLGEIAGVNVDTESWAVATLRVRLRRAPAEELGFGWSPLRAPVVEIPTGLVHAASDAVILRARMDELQGLAPVGRQPVPA